MPHDCTLSQEFLGLFFFGTVEWYTDDIFQLYSCLRCRKLHAPVYLCWPGTQSCRTGGSVSWPHGLNSAVIAPRRKRSEKQNLTRIVIVYFFFFGCKIMKTNLKPDIPTGAGAFCRQAKARAEGRSSCYLRWQHHSPPEMSQVRGFWGTGHKLLQFFSGGYGQWEPGLI